MLHYRRHGPPEPARSNPDDAPSLACTYRPDDWWACQVAAKTRYLQGQMGPTGARSAQPGAKSASDGAIDRPVGFIAPN